MACNCDSALFRRDAGTPIVLGWVRHGVLSKEAAVVSSANIIDAFLRK
jgi:hypothetical protein